MKKLCFALTILLLFSQSSAQALQFKDKNLPTEKSFELDGIIKHAEIHGDAILSSDFKNGSFNLRSDVHRAFLDYRLEGHFPLYTTKDGKSDSRLITRIFGHAFLDESIDNFFDDPLIDIPEIFFHGRTRRKKSELDYSFGRFAHRRFFNKTELHGDPFDIGEARFYGMAGHRLGQLVRINENRDDDLAPFGGGKATPTGSFGFQFGIKNTSGGIFDGWTFKQAFLVSQMSEFSDNFYGISEVNKVFGKKYPSHLNLGFLYANSDVYRFANNNEQNSYLVYSSYTQKIKNFTYYLMHGSLMTTINGTETSNHEYRLGTSYKFNKKNSIATWYGILEDGSESLGQNDNRMQWVISYKRTISKNIHAYIAMVNRYNVPDSGEPDANDGYNCTFAGQIKAFF